MTPDLKSIRNHEEEIEVVGAQLQEKGVNFEAVVVEGVEDQLVEVLPDNGAVISAQPGDEELDDLRITSEFEKVLDQKFDCEELALDHRSQAFRIAH